MHFIKGKRKEGGKKRKEKRQPTGDLRLETLLKGRKAEFLLLGG